MELCPDGLIDDLEDNNTQIIQVGDRGGYWFTFKDEYGTTVEPAEFQPAEGGAQNSKYAAHVKGKISSPSPGQWPYVGIGFNFANPKSPFDASKAKGVQFWAKVGGKLRLQVADTMTDPLGELCKDCYNHFGVDIFMEKEWVRYTVPFERMEQQAGWGDRAPRVAADKVFAVQWQFNTPGAEYDIWLDDVALVGCGP